MSDTALNRFKHTETLLRQHFGNDFMALNDESEEHLGHAGAEHGASHYEVIVSRHALKHYGSLISLHREVYQVIAHLIPHEIHAVKIRLSP